MEIFSFPNGGRLSLFLFAILCLLELACCSKDDVKDAQINQEDFVFEEMIARWKPKWKVKENRYFTKSARDLQKSFQESFPADSIFVEKNEKRNLQEEGPGSAYSKTLGSRFPGSKRVVEPSQLQPLVDFDFSNDSTIPMLTTHLNEVIEYIIQLEYDLIYAIDKAWVLVTGIGIFSMQLGFTLLEAGTIESKSVKSAIMKNINDAMFGGVIWYLFGFALSGGEGAFLGGNDASLYAPDGDPEVFPMFFQQYGFSVTAVTIVSGAILGRVQFQSYVAFSVIFLSYMYPMAAHWAWSSTGWLAVRGFYDFAGSGIIHSLGGFASISGAYLVGPRVGRFYPMQPGQRRPVVRHLKSNSIVLVNLGGFILYINWFFFNGGSSLGLVRDGAGVAAAQAIANTLVCSVFASCTTVVYQLSCGKVKEVEQIINTLLAGLVAVTAGCSRFHLYDAAVIGVLTSGLYMCASYFVLHVLCIDDPLDAFCIHGVCGLFGVICVGLFAEDGGLIHGYGSDLLVIQIIGSLAFAAWGFFNALFWFLVIQRIMGLGVSMEEQAVGLDLVHHEAAVGELDNFQVQEFALRKDMENRMIQKKKKEREEAERKLMSSGADSQSFLTKMKKKSSVGATKVHNKK